MKTYTEEIHAERTMKMFEKKDPCMCCPAAPYFNGGNTPSRMWDESYEFSPCKICTSFLGIKDRFTCPCDYFGEKEAIECTLLVLEEKGYLK